MIKWFGSNDPQQISDYNEAIKQPTPEQLMAAERHARFVQDRAMKAIVEAMIFHEITFEQLRAAVRTEIERNRKQLKDLGPFND